MSLKIKHNLRTNIGTDIYSNSVEVTRKPGGEIVLKVQWVDIDALGVWHPNPRIVIEGMEEIKEGK